MMLEDEPLRSKASNMLLRKSGGQVQVAPELMKWLGQSRKEVQLGTHLEVKGKSDAAKKRGGKRSETQHQKNTKIMATGPITSWQIEGEDMEADTD